jgi:hypothetical protein
MPEVPRMPAKSRRQLLIGFIVSNLALFFIGTVFTPEVQPKIYAIKDRLFGCNGPYQEAKAILEDQPNLTEDRVRRAYGLLQRASTCNTPQSSDALTQMGTLTCLGIGVEQDFNSAFVLFHQANTLPGASFAKVFNALENCRASMK